jgi:hypothetical protein
VIALEVSVNGTRRYVAGHINASSLVVMVQVIRPFPESPVSSRLHGVVGVPVEGRQQTDSLPYPSDRLSVGDEVTVRIVEVDSADSPSDQPSNPNRMTFVAAGRR